MVIGIPIVYASKKNELTRQKSGAFSFNSNHLNSLLIKYWTQIPWTHPYRRMSNQVLSLIPTPRKAFQ